MNASMGSAAVDVLVVGGGPGGLYAAGLLASGGHTVIVCEEHATIGAPVHCTGILASASFDEFDLPSESILNRLGRVHFVSPSGLFVEYATAEPEAVVVDRGQFDRALAARATAAGVDIRTATRVRELSAIDAGVNALAGDERISARLVLLACGATYGMQRRVGFGLPSRYLHTAQREMPA